MASKKIKAEVHLNERSLNGEALELVMSDAQAAQFLNRLWTGEVLHLNLRTHDQALAEDFNYSQ